MSDSSNKDHAQLHTAFNHSSKAYLSQLQEYIEKHQKLVTLLRDRINFCTEKLNLVRFLFSFLPCSFGTQSLIFVLAIFCLADC